MEVDSRFATQERGWEADRYAVDLGYLVSR